jgi:hypothetical protein
MQNGTITHEGSIRDTIINYENQFRANISSQWLNTYPSSGKAGISSVRVLDEANQEKDRFLSTEAIFIEVIVNSNTNMNNVKVGFDLIKDDLVVFRTHQIDSIPDSSLLEGESKMYSCKIPKNVLNEGTYSVKPQLSIHCVESLLNLDDPILQFKVDLDTSLSPFHAVLNETNHPGSVYPILDWVSKSIPSLLKNEA